MSWKKTKVPTKCGASTELYRDSVYFIFVSIKNIFQKHVSIYGTIQKEHKYLSFALMVYILIYFMLIISWSKYTDLQVFLILDTTAITSSPYHQIPAASPERCC